MPEDAHEESKPCLICQDTICSRHDLSKTRSVKTHITMLVSVSVSAGAGATYRVIAEIDMGCHAALSPAIEYVAPTLVVTYAVPSSEISYVAPAPVVFYAAPATVIERNAL